MSYLQTYESDKFNIITEAEEIENEKERIMKKFNFHSYNWNIYTNSKKKKKGIINKDYLINNLYNCSSKPKSSKYTQSNSSTGGNNSIHNSNSKNNKFNSNKNITSNNKCIEENEDLISDNTEKDLKAIVEKALVNSQIKLVNHNAVNSIIPNENELIYNKSIYTFTPTNIQLLKENSYRKKVEAIFNKTNISSNCEISNRDIFNKPKILTNYLTYKREFRFIEQVNEKNTSQPSVSINSLLSLSDYSIYTLLTFCYDKYNILIKQKLISVKLSISLEKIFEKSFELFKTQYGSVITLQSYSFALKTIKFNKENCNIFNMIMKVKVTKEIKENKCYTIACSYYADNEYYIRSWKFDLINQKESTQWICCEGQHINKGRKKYSYFQPVLSFTQGDIIEFHLPIFYTYYCINPFSIKWLEIIENNCPNLVYYKSLQKLQFNDVERERCCEIENMVHVWKTKVSSIGYGFIEEVKRYFIKCFKICEVLFDSSSFLFFKFKLKAKALGVIKKNFLLNFELEIVDNQLQIKNEIQCIGLMNINLYAEKYQIRLGSEIHLYASEMYR